AWVVTRKGLRSAELGARTGGEQTHGTRGNSERRVALEVPCMHTRRSSVSSICSWAAQEADAEYVSLASRKFDLAAACGRTRPRPDIARSDIGHDDARGGFPAQLAGLVDRLLQRDLDAFWKLLQSLLERARLDLEHERQNARRRQQLRLTGEQDRPRGIDPALDGHGCEAADRAGAAIGKDLLPVQPARVESHVRKVALRCHGAPIAVL